MGGAADAAQREGAFSAVWFPLRFVSHGLAEGFGWWAAPQQKGHSWFLITDCFAAALVWPAMVKKVKTIPSLSLPLIFYLGIAPVFPKGPNLQAR
jgi:hypothetical protein